MKAMILAAGRGERMRPLTDHLPKPLIEVRGETLIGRHLRRLAAVGIKDVVINLAHLGDQIRDALGDGGDYGVRVRYTLEPEEALETGGGILNALELLDGDPFLVVNGDIWTDLPFDHLSPDFEAAAHLVLVPNPPHKTTGDCDLNGDRITIPGDRSLTFSGMGVYRASLFGDCNPGRFPLWPVITEAASRDGISGELYDGVWFDVGAPDRLAALRQFLALKEN
jgi:MurNAc alpha-1-phosphate uridylyltransferase